ncbi:MAG: queuosine precursor transporter [Candidatus Berkiellales bacterium]
MINLLLFLLSCAFVAVFSWYFWAQGKSALTAWIAMLCLMANLFVLKQIDMLGFNATASDVFAVGNLLALNLIQEKFGREAAQRAIWVSFGTLFFFIVMSQIHLLYQPSDFDQSQNAYTFLLTPTPRILLASLVTFFIVDQFDSRFYQFLRRRLSYLPMIWVSALSIAVSQCLDTFLFSVLGLYGIVGALTEVMVVGLTIKLFAIVNTIPWSFITQRFFIKKAC